MHCAWGPTEWSPCSATCGGGFKVGYRYISQPAEHGGERCAGPNLLLERCKYQPCPGEHLVLPGAEMAHVNV